MPNADAITRLVFSIFRVNGALLDAGDGLVRDLGLTSARWQVLGALAEMGRGTVSGVARHMGLTRQSVQRVVDDLERAGLVTFAANPDHARARLVRLTPGGEAAVAQALIRQTPWAEALGRELAADEIRAAADLLATLADRLADPDDPISRFEKRNG